MPRSRQWFCEAIDRANAAPKPTALAGFVVFWMPQDCSKCAALGLTCAYAKTAYLDTIVIMGPLPHTARPARKGQGARTLGVVRATRSQPHQGHGAFLRFPPTKTKIVENSPELLKTSTFAQLVACVESLPKQRHSQHTCAGYNLQQETCTGIGMEVRLWQEGEAPNQS